MRSDSVSLHHSTVLKYLQRILWSTAAKKSRDALKSSAYGIADGGDEDRQVLAETMRQTRSLSRKAPLIARTPARSIKENARPRSDVAPSTAIFPIEGNAHARPEERAFCESRSACASQADGEFEHDPLAACGSTRHARLRSSRAVPSAMRGADRYMRIHLRRPEFAPASESRGAFEAQRSSTRDLAHKTARATPLFGNFA